jgi:predicted nucleotidyltransferase component of viral defense system
MHEKVLPKGSKKLLSKLDALHSPHLQGWVLAGGTGLALQVGHRLSEDLDFFRDGEFNLQGVHSCLKQIGDYETLQEDANTLTVISFGIKLSFFRVEDPFIFKTIPFDFFSIADIQDIALMKLLAISGRGSRKDFIDLYSILRRGLSLQELFKLLPKRYKEGRANSYHILKSLAYFEDAEREPMPKMLVPFDWKECRNFFIREGHAIVMPS